MKPSIYLAGKISKNDWRQKLVPGLRYHLWDEGPITVNSFSYTGPFFVSCDHGCNHKHNSHGAAAGYAFGESTFTQKDVIRNNMASLASTDLLFAYVTAVDCYGTIFEIGKAIERGIRTVIVFAPSIPYEDFWFTYMQADAVYFNVEECCLKHILNSEIEKTNTSLISIGKSDA